MTETATHLQPLDWMIVAAYMLATIALGLYFTRRASRDIQSFFLSDRSLPWYLVGISMVATAFASDTPLWITSLIRRYGIHYCWQYWASGIGTTLAIVLFARMWQRLRVLTDIEFLELRYSGRWASAVRFWSGFSSAILLCPFVIGWVTKAMETITREVMGLSPEYRVWTTLVVMAVALASCALSGLWGVIFTDLLQFILAIAGTVILAAVAVHRVGGLEAMTDQLTHLETWPGHALNVAPSIGAGFGQMSIWNAIGYFGILWIGVALSGGYNAQRLFSCRDGRHASYAMLLHGVLYTSVICWPWIVVAMCSVLIMPDLGAGVTDDAAYPRMIMTLMPVGLRGLLVVTMLSAFMSTISTLFNWGSSYIVNDVYKRFVVRTASDRHYVNVSRVTTLIMAAVGATISFFGNDIQHLLTIAMVVGAGGGVLGLLRWFWPRLNAAGDLISNFVGWGLAFLLLFARVFDKPFQILMHTDQKLSEDPELLGARMLLMLVLTTAVAVGVSLVTRPTDAARLDEFVTRARPFRIFWRSVYARLQPQPAQAERLGRTLVSWALAVACLYSLNYAIFKVITGNYCISAASLAVFAVSMTLTVRRIAFDSGAMVRQDELALPPNIETQSSCVSSRAD